MSMSKTEPTRDDLQAAVKTAGERLRGYDRDLAEDATFRWIRDGFEAERDRCRRDLETCDRRDLAGLQITIGTLGHVIARMSMESFGDDLEKAEAALKEHDGAFPLFPGPTVSAKAKPAPVSDEDQAADAKADNEGDLDAEEAADAPNWVTGEAANALRAQNRGRPSELQRAVDAVASGWVASVTDQTSWTTSGEKTDSAKATAYCPGSAGGAIGRASAPDLETLAARVAETDAKLKTRDKALGVSKPPKMSAKRERARKAAVEIKTAVSTGT